jgi:hypothetical protein
VRVEPALLLSEEDIMVTISNESWVEKAWILGPVTSSEPLIFQRFSLGLMLVIKGLVS